MVFLAKKWLGTGLLPLPLLLIVALLGAVFFFFKAKRTGLTLMTLAAMSVCLLSTRPVANALIRPLESTYPPYLVTPDSQAIQDIIVLGAAQVANTNLPLLSQLGNAGLARISEGIYLALAFPEARLIVSGYAGGEGRSSAELYSAVAQQFGIAPERIMALPKPKDTAEEAVAIAPLINNRRALLVTSASHMPRSMSLFNAQGAHPIAAPVGHLAKESNATLPLYTYLPSSHYLARSETAWHEYLGLLWQQLKPSAERPVPSS
ncbi:envelope biogenesis factor ElyC [Oceanisphaera avium]|uniref:Envelope biogenesis factor ElyC n=1 Tax=Oceanisphaera avium TaxID=1903694 RepID=A0A1Y0CVC7_9GAMM|nr:envelope biogenesis factor ElyC [Oceanisphaera avium]ART79168.1 envelope biogenesis factor ElyC [Oceanisphaera avium]